MIADINDNRQNLCNDPDILVRNQVGPSSFEKSCAVIK